MVKNRYWKTFINLAKTLGKLANTYRGKIA